MADLSVSKADRIFPPEQPSAGPMEKRVSAVGKRVATLAMGISVLAKRVTATAKRFFIMAKRKSQKGSVPPFYTQKF